MSTHNLCFVQKYEKYPSFLSENFQFLEMKFSVYLNRRVFVMVILIGHIISDTICILCFCVLFSNIYPKIKFRPKNWSDQYKFYGKVIFGSLI